MKTKILSGSLLILGALLLTSVIRTAPAQAEQQPSQSLPPRHQSVALWVFQAGANVDGHYQYGGAKIYDSSSSPGAPQFPQLSYASEDYSALTSIGDACALLLDNGFRLEKVSDNGLYYLFVK